MWEKCVTNSYYCHFGCWLEREHGYFQGQGSRVWEMAGAMQVSSSFQEWISAHEVFHICGKWVLWGMNLATRIWNLLSFMKENLHVPFMYLVLRYNWCQILWTMSGYWIQFFHLENWPGQSLIRVLLSGRASVWERLLPLSTCVGLGPNRRQRPHGNMKRKC